MCKCDPPWCWEHNREIIFDKPDRCVECLAREIVNECMRTFKEELNKCMKLSESDSKEQE